MSLQTILVSNEKKVYNEASETLKLFMKSRFSRSTLSRCHGVRNLREIYP